MGNDIGIPGGNTCVYFAGSDYKVLTLAKDGEEFYLDAPEQPVVYNGREGVVFLITAYLGYRRWQGRSVKTLRREAYWLAEFWDYLWNQKTSVSEITEKILHNFLDSGAKRDAKILKFRSKDQKDVFKKTLIVKRDLIYNFYDVLEYKLEIISGVIAQPGSTTFGKKQGLSRSKVHVGFGIRRAKSDNSETRSERRKAKERLNRGRPTPSPEHALMVVEAALDRSDRNRASTYYLIGSLELYAGGRSGGVVDLTIASMRQALLDETGFEAACPDTPFSLDKLAGGGKQNAEARKAIVKFLKALQASQRRFVFPIVLEKGEKARGLPVPIDLFIQLLDYIWSERAEFVNKKSSSDPRYRAPDYVFLSYATGVALQSGTISGYFQGLFKKLGIRGSGHRLRAAFAEEVVRNLYHRDKAANGGAYNLELIIELAGEFLGHENRESIHTYISNILRQERLLEGEAVVVADPEDAALIRAISEELKGPRGSDIRDALSNLAARFQIEKVPPVGAKRALQSLS